MPSTIYESRIANICAELGLPIKESGVVILGNNMGPETLSQRALLVLTPHIVTSRSPSLSVPRLFLLLPAFFGGLKVWDSRANHVY